MRQANPPTNPSRSESGVYRVIWGPQRFYLSIGWKTLIAFALVVVVPMLGLMLITGQTLRSTMEADTVHALEANLRGAWRVYHERLDSVRAALLQSAATPSVKQALGRRDTDSLTDLLERHAALLPFADVWVAIDTKQTLVARRNGPLGQRVFLNNLVSRAFTFLEPVASTEIVPNELFIEENPLTFAKLDVQVMAQVVVVPVQENGELRGALAALILLNEDDWLPNAIHDYLSIDAAVFGSVIQESRIISASNRPNNIWATGLLAPTDLRDHIRSGVVYRGKMTINEIPSFIIAEPILNSEGVPIGALSIGVKSSNIEALVLSNTQNIYMFIGVGVLLSLIVAFLAYRDTMTPMRAIMGAMDEFARGTLKVRTDLRTKDEFEELGDGFNRMAESIQEHQERVESFNSLSSLLITSLKPKDLMQNVLDKVIELTRSQAGLIYLRTDDQDEQRLVPYVAHAVDVERMTSLRFGEGLPGEAALKRRSLSVTEIPRECRLNVNFGISELLPREVAVFPIVYRETTLGVMVLATLNNFRANELSLLEYMTNQVAVVLENALTHEKVEKLSITDPLTGAYNRGYISRRLDEEFANAVRYHTPLSVLVIDVDHFKRINDRFGHHVGDEALIAIATTLRGVLRETDRLGRYGGEEFVVLLPHTTLADAQPTADKLRNAIMDIDLPSMDGQRITISVGVAGYPDGECEDAETIVRRADKALYEAKNSGRNRVVVA